MGFEHPLFMQPCSRLLYVEIALCKVTLLLAPFSSLIFMLIVGSHPSECLEDMNKQLNLTTSMDLKQMASDSYLLYASGNDYCKGVKHFRGSLACGLGEAIALNRTFVIDDHFCIPSDHNNGVISTKKLELYFNITEMERHVRVIKKSRFERFLRLYKFSGLPISSVTINSTVQTANLKNITETILRRKFSHDFGYQICSRDPTLKSAWEAVVFPDSIPSIAKQISEQLNDFDSIHVRRGDKAKNKWNWPHLDEDTRPPKLTETVERLLKWGRTVYIATDEENVTLFSPLSAHFSIWTLHNFSHFWSRNSVWWNESVAALGGDEVPVFDGALKGMVDYAVFKNGVVQVDTFNNLTSDSRNGLYF